MELQVSLGSKRTNAYVLLALLALGLVFVLTVEDPVFIDYGVSFFYFLLLSASWNLLAGYAGQLSFAQMALALAGGYATAGISNSTGMSPLVSMVLAGLVTAAFGLVMGIVTLRFREIYLGLATYAFGGMFASWALAAGDITGGSRGMEVMPLFADGDNLARYALWLALGLNVAFFAAQWAILSSRWGFMAMAVRDREAVAQGLGVRTTLVKVTFFAFTAFWAGIAGGFYASYVSLVTPAMGSFTNMGLVMAMTVVGGMGSMLGPIFGTFIFRVIDYWTSGYGGEYTSLIFAALMLAAMLFARDGVIGLVARYGGKLMPKRDRWALDRPAEAPKPPVA